MTDSDWRDLEKLAKSLQASGVNATAGQIAGQLLHETVARLHSGPLPYPAARSARPKLGVSDGLPAVASQPRSEPANAARGVTYMVGAGINRAVIQPDNDTQNAQLPLARDFFRYVLQLPKFSSETARLQPLWDFINRYWHIGLGELRSRDFDLEECFTFLELQRRDAENSGNAERKRSLSQLKLLLVWLLGEVFVYAEDLVFNSSPHQELGRRIYHERANVLTFNYDILLETAIARSSPMRPGANAYPTFENPDDPSHDLLELRRVWNPLLAYKGDFDELVVRPGPPEPVPGDEYYNRFGALERDRHPAFLKLHGSLDWYYGSGSSVSGTRLRPDGQAPRYRFFRTHGVPVIDGENQEYFEPLFITPILHKTVDEFRLLRDIWERALDILKCTKTLVVAGYSFPATDFHVRRLLREAFADHELDYLCVVNPDTGVASVARDLCNFRKPVLVCRDIGEYLKHEGRELDQGPRAHMV